MEQASYTQQQPGCHPWISNCSWVSAPTPGITSSGERHFDFQAIFPRPSQALNLHCILQTRGKINKTCEPPQSCIKKKPTTKPTQKRHVSVFIFSVKFFLVQINLLISCSNVVFTISVIHETFTGVSPSSYFNAYCMKTISTTCKISKVASSVPSQTRIKCS